MFLQGDDLREMSNLFSGKYIIYLSSAELVQRVIKIKPYSV